MNLHNNLRYQVQAADGKSLTDGILQTEQDVIAINPQSGLITLALGHQQPQQMAMRAVEVLLDDMALNLPKNNNATDCLQESFDNINEYLLSLYQQEDLPAAEQGVSMIALQLMPEHLALTALGDYSCLYFSGGKLNPLIDSGEHKLGIDARIEAESCEQPYTAGDQLLLAKTTELGLIDEDYIRVTLGRFDENLEMSLRQISARAQNQGLGHKPTILLCRVQQNAKKGSGWLSRLRK
ncbi:MAG: hypothetical protein QNJ69_10415 [Gammaproteobacteria bacterium]|nr:hypothetical protein [Gammaproteobacteria bacterium]